MYSGICLDKPERHEAMVRQGSDRVQLATGDRVAIGLALFGHAILFLGVIVTMWTKLAVLEARLDTLKDAVNDMQETVERNNTVVANP